MNLINFVLGSLGLWFLLMILIPIKKPRSTWTDKSFLEGIYNNSDDFDE